MTSRPPRYFCSTSFVYSIHSSGVSTITFSNPLYRANFSTVCTMIGFSPMCRNCFGDPDIVCVPETPLLNIPEAAIVADPLLEKFRRAGEEYTAALRLLPETVAELEKPMISAEEYIRNVNGAP